MHFSSGRAPQTLQDPDLSLNNGLLLAQVPANSPPFFAQILIAMPATLRLNTAIVIRTSFIRQRYINVCEQIELLPMLTGMRFEL